MAVLPSQARTWARLTSVMLRCWELSEAETRAVYRRLAALRNDLAIRYPSAGWEQLSMGMTDDFELAIEEGATIVRIGRAIFGERP